MFKCSDLYKAVEGLLEIFENKQFIIGRPIILIGTTLPMSDKGKVFQLPIIFYYLYQRNTVQLFKV